MLASPPRLLALQALACVAALIAVAPPRARAQSGEAPATAAPAIVAASDLYAEILLAESQDQEMDAASPGAVLGAAIDVAEKFVRLAPDEMLKSPVLTPGSRDLLPTSVGRQQLARLIELRGANWLHQVVDARFAGDRIATMFIVFTPQPTEQPKTTVTLDMVRRHDEWQVTLDLPSDAALPLGDRAAPFIAALRDASDRRLAELTSIVAAPLAGPLHFHGTWTTHFEQSFVYLSFDASGEVFILQTNDGSSGYGVHDFHVTDDEVVIEAMPGPIRLKRHAADEQYWEKDGKRHYGLVIENPRLWFPECREPLFLKPVYKGDWPVRRPPAQ